MSVVYRKAPVEVVFPAQASSSEGFSVRIPMAEIKEEKHEKIPMRKRERLFRMLPAVFVTLGSMLIANVVWPILSYQVFISPSLQQTTLVAPISLEEMVEEVALINETVPTIGAQQLVNAEEPAPKILDEELDYTNLSQWFPWQEIPEVRPEEAKTYTVDIPALNIEKAVVKVGGLNLDKSLIQFPGTANPGELGSPVIFGHSVSPLFYNPSLNNSRRYVSIFTKIMSLKPDDKIIIQYDGITYTYRVRDKLEVKPDDTYILQQRHDIRELKLVTCTPPGTYMRRGIVFAQLEDIE